MANWLNTTHRAEQKTLVLGPRTRHEIELRIRELKARLHPTIKDHAELTRLRDLLKSGERDV